MDTVNERTALVTGATSGLGLDAEALYNLGVCYAEMSRTEEADRIFQSIVQNYRDTKYAAAAAKRIEEEPTSN